MPLNRNSELAQLRLNYWTALVKYIRRHNSPISFNTPSSAHQLRASGETLGNGDFTLIALATVRPDVRVGVGVEIKNSNDYYAVLETDRFNIQNEIGYIPDEKQMFEWNPETKVNDIWLYWQTDFFDRKNWPEQHEWLFDRLEAFRRVMRPRIANLLHTIS